MIDRKYFFQGIKPKLFQTLSQIQVDGLNKLLDVYESYAATISLEGLAYCLSTTFHETGKTLMPIRELGGAAYFYRMYDMNGARPDVARRLGNTHPGDGEKFAGRSYCQITGRANYQKFSTLLGINLIDDPDLAMDPDVAAKIMFTGVRDGIFTGKRLSDYIPHDPVGARRIINGQDRAELIAGYYTTFVEALRLVPAVAQAPTPTSTLGSAPGFWTKIHEILSRKA